MIGEDRDSSLITDESCPINYGPYSLNIVKSSLPKLIYSDFELTNKSIEFKGRGLIDTGSTVSVFKNKSYLSNIKKAPVKLRAFSNGGWQDI